LGDQKKEPGTAEKAGELPVTIRKKSLITTARSSYFEKKRNHGGSKQGLVKKETQKKGEA